MATHSSILAWKIPWTEEPGGLQSLGLQRVRYDLATKRQQYFKVLSKQTKKASPLPRSGGPPLASPLLLAALKKQKSNKNTSNQQN